MAATEAAAPRGRMAGDVPESQVNAWSLLNESERGRFVYRVEIALESRSWGYGTVHFIARTIYSGFYTTRMVVAVSLNQVLACARRLMYTSRAPTTQKGRSSLSAGASGPKGFL